MSELRTIRLLLEYDGTAYAGWQNQPGQPTIQGVLEEAVRRVTSAEEVAITAAGRTDAGVHASGQVAHFSTRSVLATDRLRAALNALLPRDVRVRAVDDAQPDFHARFRAIAREYRYHIWTGSPVPPFLVRFAHGWQKELDVEEMDAAARLFVGTQDLSSFRASHCDAATPVRTVYHSRIGLTGPMVVYSIVARGFLRHMVRNIVGTLISTGRGRCRVDDVRAMIAAADRRVAPAIAPPTGLFFHRALYDVSELVVEPAIGPVLTFEKPGRA